MTDDIISDDIFEDDSDELKHYGTPRRSGRYPWGSGMNPEQRNGSLRGQVKELKKQGLSEVEIAKGFGMNTADLRKYISLEKSEQRAADAAQALRLKNKGMSDTAIGLRMGKNESSIRALLNPVLQERAAVTKSIADTLADSVNKKNYIDVGEGVENHLGISRTKLKTALKLLEDSGEYKIEDISFIQQGTGKRTRFKVLVKADTPYGDIVKNKDQIKMVDDHFMDDDGMTMRGLKPPRPFDISRVKVKYSDDGGSLKDGVIEIRRGIPELDLGNNHYIQARIAVDGDLFMKGMAIYSDDIPDGFDVIYNTSKTRGMPLNKIFKPFSKDPDNPFGSTIRQKDFINDKGEKELSAINIVNEEGKWAEWKISLSSQILSKQSTSLAKRQLGEAFDIKKEQFDELLTVTNPAVKRRLLETFADQCDLSAEKLDAAGMPRQASQIILPVMSMDPKEVYAPNYRNGERVVAIRHPHGGIFEIPELTVNNNNPEAKKMIGNSRDAVGIHPKVAEQLSGADFDGDSVIIVPNSNRDFRTKPYLKQLKNFNPKEEYRHYEGMPELSDDRKQKLMGEISNLITDMTIKGAVEDEIARAVKHSMVVIDAAKHHLDYKRAEAELGIPELRKKYQSGKRGGASTLISRAKSDKRVPERDPNGRYTIDPNTGEKIYKLTGRMIKETTSKVDEVTGKRIYTETGRLVPALSKTTKMQFHKDANELSSGTQMEKIYADHANSLKALANKARLEILNTELIPYSPSARETYSKEVASLRAKLDFVNKNKPYERHAQLLANKQIALKRQANPQMDKKDLKKLRGQVLTEMRRRSGVDPKTKKVEITQGEWNAIQAGAVTNTLLKNILMATDVTTLRERSLPHATKGMSPSRQNRARAMFNAGCTRSEIADALGVSISTLDNVLN